MSASSLSGSAVDAGKLASSPRLADLCFFDIPCQGCSAALYICVAAVDCPVPLPHVYKDASFSERVRTAWRVSLARSLSYTRLLVEACGASLWTQDSHDGSASWSKAGVVSLRAFGNAPQEWAGCLGEMMAWRGRLRRRVGAAEA